MRLTKPVHNIVKRWILKLQSTLIDRSIMASMDAGGKRVGVKQHYPVTERTKEPIREQLATVVTPERPQRMLEIASGTGQHAAYFSSVFPSLHWIPSERDMECLGSIRAYRQEAGSGNFAEPLHIDVTSEPKSWGVGEKVDLMLNVNMVHIAPWKAAVGLFQGAKYYLKPGGYLLTYGPYAFDGKLEPESNFGFDISLRNRNPEWGVRDVADLKKLAAENDMQFEKAVPVPANNHVLYFRRN